MILVYVIHKTVSHYLGSNSTIGAYKYRSEILINYKGSENMSKYKINVSIDEKNYFWIIVQDGRIINKNPTKEELRRISKIVNYNTTNICSECRRQNNITDSSILFPKNAESTANGEWLCPKHRSTKDPYSRNNIIKNLADCRTGNLYDPSNIFGHNCEELTARWRKIKRLSIEKDNYGLPLDHSIDPELGIIETKGRHFDVYQKRWYVAIKISEYEKEYDNMILWCAHEDKDTIEKGYIIPKFEINKRTGIGIRRYPFGYYEQYRIKDEETIKKANDIWRDINGR